MRILITTGIYPPDVGGPATYTKNLAQEFIKRGHEIKIISYGQPEATQGIELAGISRKTNIVLRYFKYFFQVLKWGKDADFIYTFDILSAGLPSVAANVFLRKKIILRLGGDFFWEKAANSGMKITLEDYYKRRLYPRNLTYFLIKFILNRFCLIIFSTDLQKRIYEQVFLKKECRTGIIANAFPQIPESPPVSHLGEIKDFLYVGRLIKLKNLDETIRVFAELNSEAMKTSLNIYGKGPEKQNLQKLVKSLGAEAVIKILDSIPHQQVIEKIKSSYACILPSYSEISPNFALECLSLKKPLIITRETGLRHIFENNSLLINPLDREDIKNAVLKLINAADYESICPAIDRDELSRSWNNVADDTFEIIKKYVLA